MPKNTGSKSDSLNQLTGLEDYLLTDEDMVQADMNTVRGNDVTKWSPWGKWRPSIFMPRWASRITLEITNIRVQRLQEITLQDVVAEGITPASDSLNWVATTIGNYQKLWDSINGKKYPWSSNPWVWAITFKVLKGQ